MKGVYLLIIQVGKDVSIKIGALGKKYFKNGVYCYIGSAQENLEKRIERHLEKEKNNYWHIDYLLENDSVFVLDVLKKEAGKQEECVIAKRFFENAKSIKGFGCSDCNCESHLFKLDDINKKSLFFAKENEM